MKNPGVRSASTEFDQSVSKQAHLTAMKRALVGESDLTREELIAERDRRLRETRERNPRWFA